LARDVILASPVRDTQVYLKNGLWKYFHCFLH